MENYINHICFVVDASSSMNCLSDDVVKVFDNQIKHLAELSKNLDQETRVSVYMFSDGVNNVVFDKDVLRLPSLATLYKANGMTALIDASLKGIEDLKQTCQLYGDHSFLMFVLTDGEENRSKNKSDVLTKTISQLPDNWTIATLVPNQTGSFSAQKYGFPKNNIQIWSTTSDGIEEAGNIIRTATTNYMTARSNGVRSTKNLFNLDVSALTKTAVKSKLIELRPSEYTLLPVGKDVPIKELVEGFMKEYRLGSAYYQLSKPEKIQSAKQICVQEKQNGKMYTGQNARDLLGLPDYEVKVAPAQHAAYNIFVQSTSTNRKLIGGTNVLVMK